ncbi:GNAT family N-acetyltransferase [Thermocoleostomius sinensis]|jgi:ribosomal protein S18 acetylase RimI-like enzyme|uniref:GNAT family N-acetyltransferase n=1 Tax=Thermocoleostomius sinensis A174 TaxID=2016057 RepID=A0A9E9CC61_9CYAN|nr:GNAT family N-acetyltransferase [Thermocoleostomius sinensis]WAL62075.1 GNAT family N-acetyltransferase [Thermocoleostomius sinensis A174]
MTSVSPQHATVSVRPFQYRDLDEVSRLTASEADVEESGNLVDLGRQIQQIRRWYGPLRFLSLFPNPLQHFFCTYVAEQSGRLCGLIQVSPFNRTRSTWRVDRVIVGSVLPASGDQPLSMDVGSQLLRHCFQAIWEARTWLIEVDVNDTATLALYRHNGFQTLAKMTYWEINSEQLSVLAEREPDLPNFLPVGNADASLLHQLDTVSMPPLVRQVFDRHVIDFKTSLFKSVLSTLKHWVSHTDVVSGYVFEPQRKAAIGYFRLRLCRNGKHPHAAQLTVHPAYTWLYPELLAQMARVTKDVPSQSLCVASADYQPEREEYLEQLGAAQIGHTLMMSRSVWHKLRESKFSALEGLQLSDVLQSLQPSRKPVPGRFSLQSNLENHNSANKITPPDRAEEGKN